MRECETCVNARPFGGENDNRCSVWECEYINRDKAIEAYKIIKAMREEEGEQHDERASKRKSGPTLRKI